MARSARLALPVSVLRGNYDATRLETQNAPAKPRRSRIAILHNDRVLRLTPPMSTRNTELLLEQHRENYRRARRFERKTPRLPAEAFPESQSDTVVKTWPYPRQMSTQKGSIPNQDKWVVRRRRPLSTGKPKRSYRVGQLVRRDVFNCSRHSGVCCNAVVRFRANRPTMRPQRHAADRLRRVVEQFGNLGADGTLQKRPHRAEQTSRNQ
jgi:hypothetical protein